jgi:hypothetical protein
MPTLTTSKNESAAKFLTATAFGQHFDMSTNKMSYILAELG